MRASLVLALALCAGLGHAASWKEVSCAQLSDFLIDSKGYDKNDVIDSYVTKKLEAKYPGSKFQSSLSCKKAEIQTLDSKKAKYRVEYTANCDSVLTDFKKFKCVDANEVRIGDIGVGVTFDAVCAKGVAKGSDCVPDNIAMTVTQGPRPPTPTPPNKWVPTAKDWLPTAVQAAAIKKILEVTPLKRVGPMRTPDTEAVVIPSYDITRKEDGKGAVLYRVPAFTFTKSLAGKACPYPFLLQRVFVKVGVDKAGRVSFPATPVEFKRAEMSDGTDPELEDNTPCVGKAAEWKKGVAKGKGFLKTLKKSEGGA